MVAGTEGDDAILRGKGGAPLRDRIDVVDVQRAATVAREAREGALSVG